MRSKQMLKSAAWCAAMVLCGLPGCAAVTGDGTPVAWSDSVSLDPVAAASEWAPITPDQVRAYGDESSAVKADRLEKLRRVGGRSEEAAGGFESFDPLYILSTPFTAIAETARWFVMEDADSFFLPTRFETFVSYKSDDRRPIGPDDEFEVLVDYVAIDNFSEGTVRQAWGGNGGEVSIQASMLALGTHGRPLASDPSFLNHRDVKRRCAMLALLKGNERGAALVERAESRVKSALDRLNDTKEAVAEVKETLKTHAAKTAEAVLAEWDKELADNLRKWAEGKLATSTPEVKAVGRLVTENVLASTRAWIASLPAEDALGPHMEGLPGKLAGVLDAASVTLDYLGTIGVDDDGLFQHAKVISGLADADRMLTLEFEDVRPSLLGFGREADNTGSADVLVGGDESDADVRSPRGRIFKGRLRDLASIGTVGGFSLSFLMLERDDDRVVKALRIMQQYADEKGLTIGGGISEVKASALLDAIAVVAEKIAEDDVELRAIDVRFMPSEPASGATPGTEVLNLRPCRVLVARNLHGVEFGAVARITIRRTGDAARDPRPAGVGVAAR